MSKTETQSEALRLARFQMAMQTHLGSCRESAGEYNQQAWDDYERTAATLRRLDAENKALRADAERYRWLRIQPDDCSAPRIDICHWTCDHGDSVNNGEGLRGDAADQAIDAAMAAAKTGDAA